MVQENCCPFLWRDLTSQNIKLKPTWLAGTCKNFSTASANTDNAGGIWSINAAEEVSKLMPEISISCSKDGNFFGNDKVDLKPN